MSVTRQHLESLFGPANIQKWADLNNERDKAFITSRINSALDYGTAELASLCAAGRPLPADNVIVDDIRARIAGMWLYESRGITQADKEVSPVAHHKKKVSEWVNAYLKGSRSVDKLPTAPFTICD